VNNSLLKSAKVDLDRFNEGLILGAILLLSALFRVSAAFDLSLSNDELSALTRARYDSFSEMISKGVLIDFHPAGIQTLIYYWLELFGDDPFLFRFPFVVAGVASTYLIYRIGKLWFSSFTGLLSAAIFSVFQFTILYSFFARPYSPGLFFGLLATLSWTYLFFPEPRKNASYVSTHLWWLLFTLAMIGCIHTHYFSFVFAGSLGLLGLFLLKKDILFKYLVCGLIIILSFVPELAIFNVQISTGDIGGWLASPGGWYLKDFVFHVFNDSSIISFVLLSVSLSGLFILIFNKSWSKFHSISLYLFLFSFLTAYLYSVWRHPVIQYSTMYFTVLFLLFIMAHGIEQVFTRVHKAYLIIPLVLVVGTLHTVLGKGLFSKAQFGVFGDIAKDIKEWQTELGKENVPVVLNVINPEYLNYYFRKLDFEPEIYQWQIDDSKQVHLFNTQIESSKSPYFCFSWTNAAHPYELIRIIKRHYPVLLRRKVYFNSASYLFARDGQSLANDPVVDCTYDFSSNTWVESGKLQKDSNKSLMIDSLVEFGPGYRQNIGELGAEFQLLTAKLDFKALNPDLNASLVISFDSVAVPIEYSDLNLDDCNFEPGNWQQAYLTRVIPKNSKQPLELNVYIYNRDRRAFEINNFKITIENWDNPYLPGKD